MSAWDPNPITFVEQSSISSIIGRVSADRAVVQKEHGPAISTTGRERQERAAYAGTDARAASGGDRSDLP